jgi:hypothetical protein
MQLRPGYCDQVAGLPALLAAKNKLAAKNLAAKTVTSLNLCHSIRRLLSGSRIVFLQCLTPFSSCS